MSLPKLFLFKSSDCELWLPDLGKVITYFLSICVILKQKQRILKIIPMSKHPFFSLFSFLEVVRDVERKQNNPKHQNNHSQSLKHMLKSFLLIHFSTESLLISFNRYFLTIFLVSFKAF